MKIYISSDHGGFNDKEEIKKYLSGKGFKVVDMGNKILEPTDDFTDFIIPMAESVAKDSGSVGIVMGRSGIGEVIAANKVKGIRACLCLSPEVVKVARDHDDINILALGADFIDFEMIKKVIDAFLETPYPAVERHQRRLDKIAAYESSHFK